MRLKGGINLHVRLPNLSLLPIRPSPSNSVSGDSETEDSEDLDEQEIYIDLMELRSKKHKKDIKFRGQFHCKLCPERILINELDLQQHLESNVSEFFDRFILIKVYALLIIDSQEA